MKATSLLLLALCLFSSDARSQSPFDGTWVIDTGKNENLASEKPMVLSVGDGVFREGDRQIKADGSDQKVPVTGYWDTVSVRIVDARTVEVISKKAGKPMYTETDTVSADGNTLTQVMKDTTEAEAVTSRVILDVSRPLLWVPTLSQARGRSSSRADRRTVRSSNTNAHRRNSAPRLLWEKSSKPSLMASYMKWKTTLDIRWSR